jgi:hypothetical protein
MVCRLAREQLQLEFRFSSLWERWCLVAPEDADNQKEGSWERVALLHYATLRTTNAARPVGGLPPAEAKGTLMQAAIEGAKGSSASARPSTAAPRYVVCICHELFYYR